MYGWISTPPDKSPNKIGRTISYSSEQVSNPQSTLYRPLRSTAPKCTIKALTSFWFLTLNPRPSQPHALTQCIEDTISVSSCIRAPLSSVLAAVPLGGLAEPFSYRGAKHITHSWNGAPQNWEIEPERQSTFTLLSRASKARPRPFFHSREFSLVPLLRFRYRVHASTAVGRNTCCFDIQVTLQLVECSSTTAQYLPRPSPLHNCHRLLALSVMRFLRNWHDKHHLSSCPRNAKRRAIAPFDVVRVNR
jgi:hypothetical protein